MYETILVLEGNKLSVFQKQILKKLINDFEKYEEELKKKIKYSYYYNEKDLELILYRKSNTFIKNIIILDSDSFAISLISKNISTLTFHEVYSNYKRITYDFFSD